MPAKKTVSKTTKTSRKTPKTSGVRVTKEIPESEGDQPQNPWPTHSEGYSFVGQSEQIDKLAKALVAFQSQSENVAKDSEGYGYDYLSLDACIEDTKALREKCALAVYQSPVSAGPGQVGVYTMLIHDSGQWIGATFFLPLPKLKGTNVTQMAGAAITYARRYAYLAVLGLAPYDSDAVVE